MSRPVLLFRSGCCRTPAASAAAARTPQGLQLRSYPAGADLVEAVFTGLPQHGNGMGSLNGGIISTVLDCHSADTDAAFDPGELLHLALAACGLLSADHTLQSRLGEDFVAHAEVAATKSDDGSRYEAITADTVVGMDGLDDAKRQALTERRLRAVERLCTVSHSLADGVDCQVRVRHGAATA